MAKRANSTGAAKARYPEESFIACDPKMVEIVSLLRRLANAPSNVLLSGESGTGKDVAAHALHYWGSRVEQPMIKVDLPSIPAELLESELLGYEQGAFTGARNAKPGKLELAQEGTIFLDQVSELDPALQAKLLRVVEEKRYERVGGTRTLDVQARFVASSSGDLDEAVERKAFRRDLFHRLSVFWIQLPPLRERKSDIVPLAKLFLRHETAKLLDNVPREFSREALDVLKSYSWPGNVRELKGVVVRGTLVAKNPQIETSDLPDYILDSPSVAFRLGGAKRPSLIEVEKNYIELTLRHSGGNQTRAAEILGISRKALWEKRRRYGLD